MGIRNFVRILITVITTLATAASGFAQLHHYAVEPVEGETIGTQRATKSFSVRITAQKSDSTTEASFTGTAVITSTGSLTAGGGSTAAFVGGVLSSHAGTIGNTGSFTYLVATLVDDVRPAGYYAQRFDASSLGTGIYFYRLTAGENSLLKRMLLVK